MRTRTLKLWYTSARLFPLYWAQSPKFDKGALLVPLLAFVFASYVDTIPKPPRVFQLSKEFGDTAIVSYLQNFRNVTWIK